MGAAGSAAPTFLCTRLAAAPQTREGFFDDNGGMGVEGARKFLEGCMQERVACSRKHAG